MTKEIVMVLSEKMLDCSIDKGIIVCKSGFTRDTIDYAKYKGIKLVKLWEAGEIDAEYKSIVEVATIDVRMNVIRSRANITTVDFGSRTIHFDPSVGNVYFLKLQDADGKDVPLNPYLFKFGSQLMDGGEKC